MKTIKEITRLAAYGPDLLHELEMAHKIISNALSVMTATEKTALWLKNDMAELIGRSGSGSRANERAELLSKLRSHE
ncbi:MAG: hypothetical protein LBK55_06465 [Azoarcus sp.]|jgi:hypothetical protein|nr:hypothetical protein [Azoarcus sp.]